MNDVALALDLGTTSIGALALDAAGEVRARVSAPNPAHRAGLPTGHAEQDPDRLLEAAFAALRELASGLGDARPAVLGLTGQMHGVLLAGGDGRALTPLISWQDRRAAEPGPGGETPLDRYLARCPPEALERTGCQVAPGYGAATLFVLRERGELPSGGWRALTAADWIGARLRGGSGATDRSNAASLGVFDLVEDRWSRELLDAGGIDEGWLPPVAESGASLGGLSEEAAAATGLPAGLPVANALGDNQAAVLGSLPAGERALQINIGTGGQLNWPIPAFRRAEGLETRYLPEGRFMLTGAGVSGGDAYAWVARTVGEWLEAFGAGRSEEEIYERLGKWATALPLGAGGLRCEPLFRGSRRQPRARASFSGVALDNFTPGHVARAVLEGIAEGLHQFWTAARADSEGGPRRIFASGNGVRRNRLLARILALRFGLPVSIVVHEEEAAFGAALLAGTAARLWPSLDVASRAIRPRPGWV